MHSGTYISRDSLSTLHSVISHSLSIASFPIIAASVAWKINDCSTKYEYRSCLKPISSLNTKLLHESLFIPSQLYASCGYYDLNYRVSSDLDFVLKSIDSFWAQVIYSDDILVVFTEPWGYSSRHGFKKLLEQVSIIRKYNPLIPSILFAFNRYIRFFLKSLIRL